MKTSCGYEYVKAINKEGVPNTIHAGIVLQKSDHHANNRLARDGSPAAPTASTLDALGQSLSCNESIGTRPRWTSSGLIVRAMQTPVNTASTSTRTMRATG
mmetsp:Transcript_125515/g.349397  ORF Transcript_125515/g.349397 Transcript_125515/m.349397 type:complete len:101 (+) Transcript_125515:1506-1808(+)